MHLTHIKILSNFGGYENSQESNNRMFLFKRLIEQKVLHEPIEYKSIRRM